MDHLRKCIEPKPKQQHHSSAGRLKNWKWSPENWYYTKGQRYGNLINKIQGLFCISAKRWHPPSAERGTDVVQASLQRSLGWNWYWISFHSTQDFCERPTFKKHLAWPLHRSFLLLHCHVALSLFFANVISILVYSITSYLKRGKRIGFIVWIIWTSF